MSEVPYLPVAPFAAYPTPIVAPPGHGTLIVTINHGLYLLSAGATSRLMVSGRQVPWTQGTWHVAIPAGQHQVKVTDFLGLTVMRCTATLEAGGAQALDFRVGGWRNRVYDGQGRDVTDFGLWSNYAIMLLTFGALGVLGLLLCFGLGVLATSSS